MQNYKTVIDDWLLDYFKGHDGYNKIIYDAMAYSVNIGGKRIRPTLCLSTYSMYKKDFHKILPFAAAIEMIHTYSLIHDDLPCMDNDDLRRGKATNHKVFGEGIAVLAGDSLLNEAMNLLWDFVLDGHKPNIYAAQLLSKASGCEGMIGGQVLDLLGEDRSLKEEELLYMHRKKTGELIKASVLCGATLANAPKMDFMYLEEYSEKLGLAFQVKDDLLDVLGDEKKLGKKTNSDENNHKTTFISLYGIEECKKICMQLTNDCIRALKKIEADTTNLQNIAEEMLIREY